MIARVSVENLSVGRGERVLFQGLSFALAAGEAVALIGANGAGKTSLLRAVAGFVRPLAGQVRFEGADGEREPDEARAQGLHLLGHHDGLKPGRTAWEELRFQSLWAGGTEQSARAAVEKMQLKPLLDLEIRKLSAGQRRRVSLARLAAAPRPLWLLDEPLAPLDAERRVRMGELMAAHLTGGGMILAAVHDPLPVPARAVEIGAAVA
ncbi:heme ABC exporter ATP-binding protein CcmA [Caulobacter sp. 17J65-9]|uniref:heme ABC exporter ATP-binding protein CcmA n=1 Tax=Caulobacter sp. 17J65-9 TaxID=2709382 RepID=UPI0013CDDE1A|nr:heme ABC exporter ATP-binding protein CcmA [Caulobacter sp. 17J65-9]NEX92399.1 heme ABC exporter ATP-binding protein CcmA [Caulobacter sp. 17J65-9]